MAEIKSLTGAGWLKDAVATLADGVLTIDDGATTYDVTDGDVISWIVF